MTTAIAICLLTILIVMVLQATEWLEPDVVALGAMLVLVLSGVLPAERAFQEFGSETVLLILGLLILTAALARSGVMDVAGRLLARRSSIAPHRMVLLVMVACGGISAFMSNTAATALLVPVTAGIAARSGIGLGRLLMPLAFASILTSSVTLVSTSTNIVISGLLVRRGMPPLGMFELAPVGIPIAVAGILYMYWIGRRLIPDRTSAGEAVEQFGLRPYLTEVLVREGSPLVGRTLAESKLGEELDLKVLRVVREDLQLAPSADTALRAGDVLLVKGRSEDILRVKDTSGLDIHADVRFSDPDLHPADTALVEALLLPGSPLIGRTLRHAHFRHRFGPLVLAINRHGGNLVGRLSHIRLRLGDVLLLQGHRSDLVTLQDDSALRVLGQLEARRVSPRRAWTAGGIFAAVLALSAAGVMPIAVAILLGVLAAFLARCITPAEAYRDVEWRVVLLIGWMLSLGAAMEHTGTAHYLAQFVVTAAGSAGPTALLAGFFLITVLLTQPMSNQAAAVVMLPVAIQTATHLELNPRTFAAMIAVAASCSYMTPLEPSCLLVYGPGRYRFADFLKVGALLTLLILLISLWIVPLVWPLRPR